MIELSVNLSKN